MLSFSLGVVLGVVISEFKLDIICSSIELEMIDLFISFRDTSDAVSEPYELTITDSSSLKVTVFGFDFWDLNDH